MKYIISSPTQGKRVDVDGINAALESAASLGFLYPTQLITIRDERDAILATVTVTVPSVVT